MDELFSRLNFSCIDFSRISCHGRAALLGLAALALLPAAAFAAPAYTLTDLGTLGGNSSDGTSVNNSGQVAGYSATSTGDHAFLSELNGALHDLGTLGGNSSYGTAVNSSGQVAGYRSDAFHLPQAVLSDFEGGTLHSLGALPGGNYSKGFGVNEAGQVTGYSNSSASDIYLHAFLSDPEGGTLHDLGTLPGGYYSYGTAVNNSGQVAGYGSDAFLLPHAFLSDPNGGALHDLGTLTGGLDSYGRGVNDFGQVTGYSSTSSGNYHAFLSGFSGGALQDLGTLGGSRSEGHGVNDFGQVTGYSDTSNGSRHAFLFEGDQMFDLNTLIDPFPGFTLVSADSISDRGFITGYGVNNSNGQTEAFLLAPTIQAVPEASTTVSFGLLLTLGLGGAFVAAKKKKSA